MDRMAGVLLAGGLLALGCADRASAAPEPDAPTQARAHAVVARAHLVFRSEGPETSLEGRVTVVEHPSGAMVVEEIGPACESDCARRRLAWVAPPARRD